MSEVQQLLSISPTPVQAGAALQTTHPVPSSAYHNMTSKLDNQVAALAQRLQHFVFGSPEEQRSVSAAVCDADPSVIKRLVVQGYLHSVLQQTVARISVAQQSNTSLVHRIALIDRSCRIARVLGALCEDHEAAAVLSQQQPQQHLCQLIQLVADKQGRPEVRDDAEHVLGSIARRAAGARVLLSGSRLQLLQQHSQEILVQRRTVNLVTGLANGLANGLATTKEGRHLLSQQLGLLRSVMQVTCKYFTEQDGPEIVARVVKSEPKLVAALVEDYNFFCEALEIVTAKYIDSDGGGEIMRRQHLAVIVAAAQVQPGEQDNTESVLGHALSTLENIARTKYGAKQLLNHHMAGILAVLAQCSQPQYSTERWQIAAGLATHSTWANIFPQHKQLVSEALDQCRNTHSWASDMLTELAKHPAGVEQLMLQQCLQQLCSKHTAMAHVHADDVTHPAQTTAAAGLGPDALTLVKHEVGVMPNEQQLQYWRLADQSFDAAELQQLAERYFMPRMVTRGYYESRSGRQRDVLKQGPPAIGKYETLAPVLLQLWQQVQADPAAAAGGPAAAACSRKRRAAGSSAAAQLTASTATKTLLRALRTLQLWEAQQTTQLQMPQALQCLVPKQPSNTVSSSAAAEVQEVINLTRDDDDVDGNSSEQMQQFLAGQLDIVLVREFTSSKSGRSASPKRIKVEPPDDME